MLDIFKTDNISLCSAPSLGALDSFFSKHRSLPEVAFVGRSNVGKSTLINKLAGKNKLALTSKTPGKTQAINLFNFNNKFILVDLPGYGYANVAREKLKVWSSLITHYILNSTNLKMLFLLIDARRGIGEKDLAAIEWIEYNQIPTLLVVTKADYILERNREKLLEEVNCMTKKFSFIELQKILVSSKENLGENILKRKILEFI